MAAAAGLTRPRAYKAVSPGNVLSRKSLEFSRAGCLRLLPRSQIPAFESEGPDGAGGVRLLSFVHSLSLSLVLSVRSVPAKAAREDSLGIAVRFLIPAAERRPCM